MQPAAVHYDRCVFVNCPFDDDYRSLLHPLLFTILDLGFEPRIANARQDSGEQRVDKIIGLIEQSRFGIHDLSRCQASKADEFYRLNMPFELGLDVACRRFGGERHAEKTLLVLESKSFRYQAALSDIAGCDIAIHNDEAIRVVTAVRGWLNEHGRLNAIGPSGIWSRFNDYSGWSYDDLLARRFSPADITALPMSEQLDQMRRWIAENPI